MNSSTILPFDAARTPGGLEVIGVGTRQGPLVQAFPAVTEAVIRSLVGAGDEPVEGRGHVENGCGHGVSFPGRWPQGSGSSEPSTGRRLRAPASATSAASTRKTSAP